MHSHPVDIQKVFQSFYEKLFREEKHMQDVHLVLEDILEDVIPRKVDLDYGHYIDRNLSIEDLEHVVFSMAHNKSPGIDGLSIEFYQTLWEHIKEDLYYVYLEAIKEGSLGPEINRGLIKLFPKGKNIDLISGWRPITLLNTSYKIIAKALATRIKPVTQMIVRSEQTGFLGGRFILDNLMLAWEACEWAR